MITGLFPNKRPTNIIHTSNSNDINEHVLGLKDYFECCICLSEYADGEEFYVIPCNHHSHCECISKWLQANGPCPLHKYSVMRDDSLV
ncbi:hypothetical protein FEM48_Zijuj07G0146500 [Ziziphus jujuba var. spinosa]|uniref:RING-type E3 ubiquitin transferase n=1 Tax=Ziziphus jujuba var. spinosa TaxID=714518 RepID=A0A978V580_ZIZJJ|nr:hypothetical protein FEM48_Zijuj07G0146500 [Ziziphus jujuba var. spinosa]